MSQDVAAAFITSFHTTRGNILEWSASISSDLSLAGIEFSSLPSGLHSVQEDVIYFTSNSHDAVCVFKQSNTGEEGRKGIRMRAIGVVLARSPYPRPWHHIGRLRRLTDQQSVEAYFQTHKANSDIIEVWPWLGWPQELLPSDISISTSPLTDSPVDSSSAHPLRHLPSLLHIIGPSYITIYKYVVARKRVLIYTQAPVEAACILARTLVDVASGGSSSLEPRGGDDVLSCALGIIGLTDVDKLETKTTEGCGWVACTTDKIFLDKGHLYDLLVDLSAISPSFQPHSPLSLARQSGGPLSRPPLHYPLRSGTTWQLRPAKFTFSDMRDWSRMEAVIQPEHSADSPSPTPTLQEGETSSWITVWNWKICSYEDICFICASLWLRGWIAPEKDRRSLKKEYRDTVISEGQGESLLGGTSSGSSSSSSSPAVSVKGECDENHLGHSHRLECTVELLEVFREMRQAWFDGLERIVGSGLSKPVPRLTPSLLEQTVWITPQQMTTLGLSALSDADSQFIECLASSRAGKDRKMLVKVRRGWREIIRAMTGW